MITIKNLQKKTPICPTRIKKTILKVLSLEKEKKIKEINVCFVTNKEIKELNKKYRMENKSTDVLAFDMPDDLDLRGIYADIVISADMAISNAKIFHTAISYELNLYLVHGLLHILGYGDKTWRQKQLIRQKEKKYVNP